MSQRSGKARAKELRSLRVVPYSRNRTIEALTGTTWGAPSYNSYLVRRCHELVTKQVSDLTVEDLRLLIGQNIALPYLIPLALEKLEEDPLAAGDFHPGDLLDAVTRSLPRFWEVNPALRSQLEAIIASVPAASKLRRLDEISRSDEEDDDTIDLVQELAATPGGPQQLITRYARTTSAILARTISFTLASIAASGTAASAATLFDFIRALSVDDDSTHINCLTALQRQAINDCPWPSLDHPPPTLLLFLEKCLAGHELVRLTAIDYVNQLIHRRWLPGHFTKPQLTAFRASLNRLGLEAILAW